MELENKARLKKFTVAQQNAIEELFCANADKVLMFLEEWAVRKIYESPAIDPKQYCDTDLLVRLTSLLNAQVEHEQEKLDSAKEDPCHRYA